MIDELGLSESEKTLALAATMIVQLGMRHDISDEDMNAACARSLEIVLHAEAEHPKAMVYVEAAMFRLHTIWKTIHAARGGKVLN